VATRCVSLDKNPSSQTTVPTRTGDG
jgi:hypothetical protein